MNITVTWYKYLTNGLGQEGRLSTMELLVTKCLLRYLGTQREKGIKHWFWRRHRGPWGVRIGVALCMISKHAKAWVPPGGGWNKGVGIGIMVYYITQLASFLRQRGKANLNHLECPGGKPLATVAYSWKREGKAPEIRHREYSGFMINPASSRSAPSA